MAFSARIKLIARGTEITDNGSHEWPLRRSTRPCTPAPLVTDSLSNKLNRDFLHKPRQLYTTIATCTVIKRCFNTHFKRRGRSQHPCSRLLPQIVTLMTSYYVLTLCLVLVFACYR